MGATCRNSNGRTLTANRDEPATVRTTRPDMPGRRTFGDSQGQRRPAALTGGIRRNWVIRTAGVDFPERDTRLRGPGDREDSSSHHRE